MATKESLERVEALKSKLQGAGWPAMWGEVFGEYLAAEIDAARLEERKRAADIVECELKKCEDGVDVRAIQRLNRAWHAIRLGDKS